VRELLTEHWKGTDLITFGNVAFDWFRLAFPSQKTALRAFWSSPDRYESTYTLQLPTSRVVQIRPLPHPSPLNATWYKRLPRMIDDRLAEAGVTSDY
jgi:uracil-DNA glycosylase